MRAPYLCIVFEKPRSMDWQNILMIIITVLLLFVWLPVLILSVRRALRKEKEQSDNK